MSRKACFAGSPSIDLELVVGDNFIYERTERVERIMITEQSKNDQN